MDPSQVKLSCDEFTGNSVSVLGTWLYQDQFKDFTLASQGGGMVGAHKIILSSRSSFLRNLFQTSQNPIFSPVNNWSLQHINAECFIDPISLVTIQTLIEFQGRTHDMY